MKILRFIPWGWLADFGHGVIITSIVLYFFGVEYQLYLFVAGVVFSILPDLDGLDELIRYRSVAASEERPHDHREGLHYPVIWLVVGVVWIYFYPVWGTLFLSCVLVHFLNDSWGTGWGIQWLWPLSDRSYKLFSRKEVDADVTFFSLISSWTPTEKQEVMSRLGNPDWVRDNYLKLTHISIIEIGTFIIGMILVCIILIF